MPDTVLNARETLADEGDGLPTVREPRVSWRKGHEESSGDHKQHILRNYYLLNKYERYETLKEQLETAEWERKGSLE